jgi:hypothetical protein
MKLPDGRRFMLALRAWTEEDESGRNGQRVVESIYDEALSAHFGLFKFLIDLVDGKLRQIAEDELTFENCCTIMLADNKHYAEMVESA